MISLKLFINIYMNIIENRLWKWAGILYFLLIMTLWAFALIYPLSEEKFVSSQLIFLFSLLLLPLFELSFWKQEVWFFSDKRTLIFILLFALIFLLFSPALWMFMSLAVIISVVFRINSQVFFLVALGLFVYVGYFLLFWESNRAEELSIFAYYFLIAGVLCEFLSSFIFKKPNETLITTD